MTSPVAVLAAHRVARTPEQRMEELIYTAAAGTLAGAGLTRAAIDSVILAASDERDGRSISSMLAATPAGGMYREVTKVTDGSLHALALAVMKIQAGQADAVLVVSWDVSSEAPLEAVAASALEPFADRPVGAIDPIATALQAGGALAGSAFDPAGLDARAATKAQAAAVDEHELGDWTAYPLRRGHEAPELDAAAAVLLVSPGFLARSAARPLAHVEGVGWRTDTYAVAERMRPAWRPLRDAFADALLRAQVTTDDIDSFELEDASVFGEVLAAEGLGLIDEHGREGFLRSAADPLARVADDGFAGLPRICSGIWRLAQVCERALGGERSLLHQTVGRAAQGHAVAIVRQAANEESS